MILNVVVIFATLELVICKEGKGKDAPEAPKWRSSLGRWGKGQGRNGLGRKGQKNDCKSMYMKSFNKYFAANVYIMTRSRSELFCFHKLAMGN